MIERAERQLCARWKPILKRLGSGRAGDSRYAAATAGSQPKWIELPTAKYRAFLDDWMFLNTQRPLPGRSLTRVEAANRVGEYLQSHSIRLWQAKVKFRRFAEPQFVTRIGLVPLDENKPRKYPSEREFKSSGYSYNISPAGLPRSKPNPDIDRELGYMFLDRGFGYIANPSQGRIMMLYPLKILKQSPNLIDLCLGR